MNKILVFSFALLFLISLTSAFDSQTPLVCGGDNELMILCNGNDNNSVYSNIKTGNGVTYPSGYPFTEEPALISKNLNYLCNFFEGTSYTNKNVTITDLDNLLVSIFEDSSLAFSKSDLSNFLKSYNYFCVEEKPSAPFVLILFIIIIIVIIILLIKNRKKMKELINGK